MKITDALQLLEEHSTGATEKTLREARYYIIRLEEIAAAGGRCATYLKDIGDPNVTDFVLSEDDIRIPAKYYHELQRN